MIDRFHAAFQSPLGSVLLLLVLVLLALGAVYAIMLYNKRRQDLLTYRNIEHYRRAWESADIKVQHGEHQANFFGRETNVELADGRMGLCLIPPPNEFSDVAVDRFKLFAQALEKAEIPLFASHLKYGTAPFYLIQKHARPLTPLTAWMRDSHAGIPAKEDLLIDLARALHALHQLKDAEGNALYHGFLLPRSCFIDSDNKLVINDLGIAFALGQDFMRRHVEEFRQGALPVDPHLAHHLSGQLLLLPPEIRTADAQVQTGVAGDYFAFAALAVLLFTGERQLNQIDWGKVPQLWQPFLKQCLSDKRPVSFHDLEEWLYNPEIELTHLEAECAQPEPVPEIASVIPEKLAIEIPDAVQASPEFQKFFVAGVKAQNTSKWEAAKKNYSAALLIEPGHLECRIKMAICCFELGLMPEAEEHYRFVKERDPAVAKTFRKHAAFRL